MLIIYVKKHSITGLKYFGVTTKNPYKYVGSGTHWLRHINKHGKYNVSTIDVWGFDNQKDCTYFALKFSRMNNIVESREWANQREEDGVVSNRTYKKRKGLSEEQKKHLSWKSLEQFADKEKRQYHKNQCVRANQIFKTKKWCHNKYTLQNTRIYPELLNEYQYKDYVLGRFIPEEDKKKLHAHLGALEKDSKGRFKKKNGNTNLC